MEMIEVSVDHDTWVLERLAESPQWPRFVRVHIRSETVSQHTPDGATTTAHTNTAALESSNATACATTDNDDPSRRCNQCGV